MLEKIDPFLLDVAESVVKLAVISCEALARTLAIFEIHARSEVSNVVPHLHVRARHILIAYF